MLVMPQFLENEALMFHVGAEYDGLRNLQKLADLIGKPSQVLQPGLTAREQNALHAGKVCILKFIADAVEYRCHNHGVCSACSLANNKTPDVISYASLTKSRFP
jgi:hypothetical protein